MGSWLPCWLPQHHCMLSHPPVNMLHSCTSSALIQAMHACMRLHDSHACSASCALSCGQVCCQIQPLTSSIITASTATASGMRLAPGRCIRLAAGCGKARCGQQWQSRPCVFPPSHTPPHRRAPARPALLPAHHVQLRGCVTHQHCTIEDAHVNGGHSGWRLMPSAQSDRLLRAASPVLPSVCAALWQAL